MPLMLTPGLVISARTLGQTPASSHCVRRERHMRELFQALPRMSRWRRKCHGQRYRLELFAYRARYTAGHTYRQERRHGIPDMSGHQIISRNIGRKYTRGNQPVSQSHVFQAFPTTALLPGAIARTTCSAYRIASPATAIDTAAVGRLSSAGIVGIHRCLAHRHSSWRCRLVFRYRPSGYRCRGRDRTTRCGLRSVSNGSMMSSAIPGLPSCVP